MANDSRQTGKAAGGAKVCRPSDLLGWLMAFAAKPGRILELIRYTGASGIALALDTAVFVTLVAFSILPASLSAAIGYLAGCGLHYALSVRYIFAADKTGKTHRRLLVEFLGTGLLGLVLTVAVIRLTVDGLGLPPLIGKVLSSAIAFVAVYVARAGVVLAARADGRIMPQPRARHGEPPHATSGAAVTAGTAETSRARPQASRHPPGPAWDGRAIALLCIMSICLFAPILKRIYWPAGGGIDVTGHQIGRDFINFWAAPQIAFGTSPTSLFDLALYNEQIRTLFGADIPFHMWSYPPVVLLATWGFAQLSYGVALATWVLGSFAIFARIAVSAIPAGSAAVALLALALSPAALINAVGGQNGFFTGALMLGALLSLDRRPILAGVLVGLLTCKPQLGLVLPFILIALGAWRTIAAATLTALAVYGASVAVLGLDFWQSYIGYTATHQAGVVYEPANFWSSMMMSPMAGLMALGAGAHLAGVMQIAVAVVVIAIAVHAVRGSADPLLRMLVIVSATPLVPHQVFNYDLPMLAAAWLIVMLHPVHRAAPASWIAKLVWLSPLIAMLAFFFKVPAISQLILVAGFAASVRLALRCAPAARVDRATAISSAA